MKQYRSFDEFAREELRSMNRVGFSMDEFDIDSQYNDELLFDDSEMDDDE